MNDKDKQIKEIQKRLDIIWNTMGNEPAKEYSDLKKIEKESIKLNYQKEIKKSRLYQGWCLIYLSRLKEAIEILTDLSGDYKKDEPGEFHIKVLNALGVAYNDLGDNTNAFNYYSKSLKLSRKANLLERELSVLNNLGMYFLDNKNYDKALNHYLQILGKAEKSELSLDLKSVVLGNIGLCYSNLKKYREAEKYLLQSMVITKQLHNRINEVENLHDLAAVKIGLKEKESAIDYIKEALDICDKIENKRTECELLLMLGEIENSRELYEKALKISKSISFKPVYSNCCLKISNYFENSGDYKKSLEYLKLHHKTENELNNLAAEKKFHNLEMEYEIERNRKNTEVFKIKNLELKESLNWMTILNRIAQETMSSLELHNIFHTVYKNINIIMDAAIFHVAFYDIDKDSIDFFMVIENGNEIKPFSRNAGKNKSFTGWSIKNRKEVVINNIEKEYNKYIKKRSLYGEGPSPKSLITVPLFSRDDVIGAISIQSYYENAYKEEHVQLLKSLSSYCSIAIDNSRNYEKVNELNKIILKEKEELETANRKISDLASHDNLTGLNNRRLFNELLESAMLQTDRRGETLAVLFIDLDNFKPVNDTWGHAAGDEVLIEISNRFLSNIRSSDSVARIGGDEFLILLNPVKNRNDARTVAQKIMNNVCLWSLEQK